ncbi:hypothetical protein ABZX77_03035 [Streptomyces sp. NPDC004237]|uniref:hypothetical protein n=1 Tax=Streptomyces sp. NPDC004237 TaxID=3154455 RepID=UPI0033A82C5E
MKRRTRRSLMAAAVLAVVLLTGLTLRWMSSSGTASGTTDSASGGTTLTSGTATDVVALTIAEPAVGTTAVDVRLTPRKGTTTAASVTVSAVLPTAGHAVPDFTAVRTADHRYHVAGLPLMMPGRWELLVDIDADGRHDHLVFPLTISS